MQIITHKEGFIEQLIFNGEKLIFPWGVECGDSQGFFSQTESGARVSVEQLEAKILSNSSQTAQNVKFSDGRLNILTKNQWDGNQIKRNVSAIAKENTLLMDFALRYRFRKNVFPKAHINGKKISHTRENLYHQYLTNKVILTGSNFKSTIILTKVSTAGVFKPYMYVRDFEDEWVVHCRLLPTIINKEVLKLNAPWYNRAIPRILSNFLLKVPIIKKQTWYRTERKKYSPWNFPCRFLKPSSYPLALLKTGQEISINSVFRVESLT